MAVSQIPSTRISDGYSRLRLLTQLHADQIALLRIEQQVSTGRRIIAPSEDVPASLRAIDLQRLLERKEQAQKNLQANQQYLSATDTALASVASLLTQARSLGVDAIDSGAGANARTTAADQIDQLVRSLVDIGNERFRGRSLFGGSRVSGAAYSLAGGNVRFDGDVGRLLSYSDIDTLFETNLDGHQVFGGLSDGVRGFADLERRLTADTPLADLRGGQGIPRGSIALSDGSTTRIIDLGSASTLGDVVSLIERDPPAGSSVTVDITPTGLKVQLSSPGAGNLTIKEVGGGTTAEQLGILETYGVGELPLVGGDLDPRVTNTTRLADLLGVRATARLAPTGGQNDLRIEAVERGPEFNGVTVTIVNGGVAAAGAESAVYDDSNPLDKKLIVTIASGFSTANAVAAAINAEGTFQATLDPREADNDGTGGVLATAFDPAAMAVTAGGAGEELDLASGLRIEQAGQTYTVDLSTAATVEDVLNAIHRSGAAVLAEISADGRGIDLLSRMSGADFSVGENGGDTATQLGVRSFTAATPLSQLNHGRGVHNAPGADFTIRRKDGGLIQVDIAGAVTVGDVLAIVNGHVSNGPPAVTARLARFGNGIELVSTDPAVAATFAVLGAGPTATDLGLLPPGASVSAPAVISGGTETITGRDPNPLEVQGAYNALVRLRDALRTGTLSDVERAINLLDAGSEKMNLARGELGGRQQTLDVLADRMEQEEIELRAALSREIDVDLVEAISELTARQTAYQASLQLTARISQLSLLDFI